MAVDALCVGYGFRPSAELAQLLGCACTLDPASGDLVPVTDAWGRTSLPTVFMAGEAMGIAGVHAARVRGALAAEMIVAALHLTRRRRRSAATCSAGHVPSTVCPADRCPVSGSDWLYQAMPDETIVCRCECVTAAASCARPPTQRALTSTLSRPGRVRGWASARGDSAEIPSRRSAQRPGKRASLPGTLPAPHAPQADPGTGAGSRARGPRMNGTRPGAAQHVDVIVIGGRCRRRRHGLRVGTRRHADRGAGAWRTESGKLRHYRGQHPHPGHSPTSARPGRSRRFTALPAAPARQPPASGIRWRTNWMPTLSCAGQVALWSRRPPNRSRICAKSGRWKHRWASTRP